MLSPLSASVLSGTGGLSTPPAPITDTKPFMSSNDILGEVSGAGPIGTAMTPPAPPVRAPLSAVAAPTDSYKSKYDEIFDKAQGLLTDLLDKKQGIDPVGLAMAQGFLAPTKTGSFGESIFNVAKGVREAQSEANKGEIDRLQAQMRLASLGSERDKENEAQRLMGLLYKDTGQGLKTDPTIAQQLFSITKDPRFVQQAIAEEQLAAKKKIGMSMFQQKVVPGKDGEPGKTVIDFNPNAVYDLMKISQDPIKDLSEFSKVIPELRKSGLLGGLQEEGTPFDALILMAPTDAVKKQAEYLAKQFTKGMIDPDKANTMANSMMTMAQAHMDKQDQQKFQQAMSGMMMSMKQDSLQLMRDKFAETQKENEKKLSDSEKILYRNSVIPIINEGNKASEALTALSQIQKVAEGAPSGAINGALASSVGALFGTDDNTALRNLRSLTKNLVTKVPRLPGSQSNLDAKNLEEGIGKLADPTLTNKQRMVIINQVAQGFQALQSRADEVNDYWQSNHKLPKFDVPTNLGLTPAGGAPREVDFKDIVPRR